MSDRLKVTAQYLLPKQALTVLAGKLASARAGGALLAVLSCLLLRRTVKRVAALRGLELELVSAEPVFAGERLELSDAAYCEQLQRPATRFEQMTGQRMRAIFRAPGGRTSPRLLAAAQRCGWQHVPWTPNGFLGDELDSDRYPNTALLEQALRRVRKGGWTCAPSRC